MTSKYLIGGALALAVACVIGYWFAHRPATPPTAPDAPVDNTTVLVQTAKVSFEQMPLTLNVFGEVGPAKVESLSFPQAGQLARLAVTAGQVVHKGDVLATLSSDPAALVAYEQAVSALAFARREQQRLADLLALQLATQSQLDAARKQAQDAQATLAAQEKLGGAHMAANLPAPYDAVVTALPVAQGERVAAGATVVQLGRSAALRVLLAVEPARAAELRAGMAIHLAGAQPGAAPVEARIASVQNMVDPKTQMASAIVLLPPPARDTLALAVGLRVQGTVELGKRAAWSVPRQAVLVDEQGAYLFQVAKDSARRVAVRKLVESGGKLGVTGPLDPALPVVILGNYELQDGARVRGGAR